MNRNTRKSLETEILNCKKRLKELAPDIEFDEEKATEYNKIIVQKAILLDNYKKLCYKPSLKEKLMKLLPGSMFKTTTNNNKFFPYFYRGFCYFLSKSPVIVDLAIACFKTSASTILGLSLSFTFNFSTSSA